MPNPLNVALDAAVRKVRSLDAPLAVRLRHVADLVRDLSPAYATAVDGFVKRLENARAGELAPSVGEAMPDFMLPDQDGRMVSLEELRRGGPVILVFHRGHWCPYCRLTIARVAEIAEQIAPYRLVAISPERQKYTRMMQSDSGARFPFLSDVGSGYALSINLAIWIDDDMAALIAGGGRDIAEYQGIEAWIMPIPAVFIVDTDGRVIARHVDPDYRRRIELEDVLGMLERFGHQPA